MAEEAKKTEGGETEKELTVQEIAEQGKNEGKAPEMVPLSSLLEFKNENKVFKKKIADLEEMIQNGTMKSKEDVSDELTAIAEEFDVDPKFVKKLAGIFDAKSEKRIGEVTKPFQERDQQLTKEQEKARLDKIFQAQFEKTLETMPEYKDIADGDVIKTLSFLPENQHLKFSELIEKTYGKAITGSRTIDKTRPAGGKDPEPIDFDRAKKDVKYFEQIMADPDKKKLYNENLIAGNKKRRS